jgi:chromosome partitioning protein
MMPSICIANQKGGVGKTTTAIHLALGASWAGLRVVLCDLDAQANATSGLGLGLPGVPLPRPLPSGREGLDVLFLGRYLQRQGQEVRTLLRSALPESGFDLTFFDCPPAFGPATDAGLDLADSVIIPIQCEYFAMEGLTQILSSIQASERRRGRPLGLLGILLTLYDPSEAVSVEVAEEVRRNFPEAVFRQRIERDPKFVEASSFGKALYEYDLTSPGAWEYLLLTREVLRDVGKQAGTQAV